VAVLTRKAWQCFEPIKRGFLDDFGPLKEGSAATVSYDIRYREEETADLSGARVH